MVARKETEAGYGGHIRWSIRSETMGERSILVGRRGECINFLLLLFYGLVAVKGVG